MIPVDLNPASDTEIDVSIAEASSTDDATTDTTAADTKTDATVTDTTTDATVTDTTTDATAADTTTDATAADTTTDSTVTDTTTDTTVVDITVAWELKCAKWRRKMKSKAVRLILDINWDDLTVPSSRLKIS